MWRTPDIDRTPFPAGGDERALLLAWLDHKRETFLFKISGLTEQQLKTANAEPSTLTLHGLLRHMADNERWIRRLFTGGPDDDCFFTDDNPDAAFTDLSGADPEADYGVLLAEMDHVRAALPTRDLDEAVVDEDGDKMTLRVAVLHVLEEYSRHTGHADLIRQRLDGAVGH
ncbi:DUF664 domain-containing protein [Actinokineospora terrae]|uniref:DinB superfamily protein n=1 Tax=Actinokineospora terrae TaxID=155974 RepID=A0A1H9KWL0_9PSEU|nr:DUF664 domain-containing protein [Actinokineospora terrae]SER03257.1 Protein of unknown function [Actinokineospora terrae]